MEGSRPRVIFCAAMSMDGKISTRSGDSGLSSGDDLRRLHRLRAGVDAILVGKKTIIADDPLLTVRHVKGKNPVRVILSSTGDIPAHSRILVTAKKIPTIMICTERITGKTRRMLEGFSVRVITAGKNSVNLERMLLMLYRENIESILLEGGGTTSWEFVRRDLIDEVFVTISPRMLGGADSATLVDGAGFPRIRDSPGFKLKRTVRLGDEIVLHYARPGARRQGKKHR